MRGPFTTFSSMRRPSTGVWMKSLILTMLYILVPGMAQMQDDSHAPSIIRKPSSHTVMEGTPVFFFCQAEGVPIPVITWTVNGRRRRSRYVSSLSRPLLEGNVTSSSLRIDRARSYWNNSDIHCVAQNFVGRAMAPSNLIVLKGRRGRRTEARPPGFPVIVKQPEITSVEIGQSAVLKCLAEGDPTPNVTWWKDFPVNVNGSDGRFSITKAGSLIIHNAHELDQGQYQCAVENKWGVTYSNRPTLYVRIRRIAPRFMKVTDNIHVDAGSDGNLTCQAFGAPMPFVTWRLGDVRLTPEDRVPEGNNTLRLTDIRRSQNYTCTAESPLGIVRHTVQVVVKVPPAPQNVKLRRTSPTSMSVTWDEMNTPVAGYKIYYSMFTTLVMDLWDREEVGPSNVARIHGLQAHTVYAVRVQAKSEDGRYGNLSAVVVVPSEADTPDQTVVTTRASDNLGNGNEGLVEGNGKVPPAPQNVKVRRSTPTSMSVTWDEMDTPVAGHKIYYGMFNTSSMDLWDQEEVGPSNAARIHALRARTPYAVRVQAKSEDGRYGNLSAVVIVSSEMDTSVPPAPQNVKVRRTTPTSMSVTWDEMDTPVAGYKIYYTMLNISLKFMELWDEVEVGPSNAAKIHGLEAHEPYTVRVQAKSKEGRYGNLSAVVIVSIKADTSAPPAPQNVKVRRTTPTSMSVTWDEADTPVAGHKIYYGMFNTSSMDPWDQVEVGPSNAARIHALRARTPYTVRVQAKSEDGRYGNLSAVVIVSSEVDTSETSTSTSTPTTNSARLESVEDDFVLVRLKRPSVGDGEDRRVARHFHVVIMPEHSTADDDNDEAAPPGDGGQTETEKHAWLFLFPPSPPTSTSATANQNQTQTRAAGGMGQSFYSSQCRHKPPNDVPTQ